MAKDIVVENGFFDNLAIYHRIMKPLQPLIFILYPKF